MPLRNPQTVMAAKHWKEEYEDASDAARKGFNAESVDALRARIRRRDFGNYYAIWHAIADTKNLPAFGWILFDFVASSEDYLQRYNCARALLTLMNSKAYEPQHLTVKHLHPEAALADVEQQLTQAIGPRPA